MSHADHSRDIKTNEREEFKKKLIDEQKPIFALHKFFGQLTDELEDRKRRAQMDYRTDRNRSDYTIYPPKYQEVKKFEIPKDDNIHSKKWNSLFSDIGFYYDTPTLRQKQKIRKTLQLKYDDLFDDGWQPPLNNRRDLLLWACERHNDYLVKNNAEDKVWNCVYNDLIQKFGPNYDILKSKLSFMRDLF